LLREADGAQVLLLRVAGRLYAYRPACPGCGAALAEGALDGRELACPGCARRYDVRRAGRPLGAEGAPLEPLPLLSGDDGRIKVAAG
jgi:nitrite reductase/ring-hydroxylating ferredoxin subunit